MEASNVKEPPVRIGIHPIRGGKGFATLPVKSAMLFHYNVCLKNNYILSLKKILISQGVLKCFKIFTKYYKIARLFKSYKIFAYIFKVHKK